MKIHEITEGIERIAQYITPHTDGIKQPRYIPKDNDYKPVPGGAGLVYTITTDNNFAHSAKIYIFTAPGGLAIGRLLVDSMTVGPMTGMSVEMIEVAKDYHGKGIATSLYGIVLTVMKHVLFAGSAQSPDGRRQWLNLNTIPGCEVKGMVALSDSAFDPSDDEMSADNMIDTVMNLGGQYLGEVPGRQFGPSKNWSSFDVVPGRQFGPSKHWFSFDVVPGTTELEPAVKKTVKLYGDDDSGMMTQLYARWTG